MTGSRRIVFRADGGKERGLGHVYRSAAFAAMLSGYDTELCYVQLGLSITAAPVRLFTTRTVLADDSVAAFCDHLRQTAPAAVVLDGYHLGPEMQAAVRELGIPLICIDDLHEQAFLSNLVINHAPIPQLERLYEVREQCGGLALGLAYALLKPAFLLAARSAQKPGEREGLYLNFGGSDPRNVTAALIQALNAAGISERLEVVLGAANRYGTEVSEAANQYEGPVRIHRDLNDEAMIELYRSVRLAFLPASTVMAEALATGVPVVGGFYVTNQEDVYRGYLDNQLILGVGDWLTQDGLKLAAKHVRSSLFTPVPRTRVLAHIDGYSDVNLRLLVGQVIAGELPIALRPMIEADARQLFEWANDPVSRATAIKPEPILWEEHLAWFERRIADPGTLLLHCSIGGEGCGQVRYDVDGDKRAAVVSISVAGEFRGRGLSKRLIALGEAQLRARYAGVDQVLAYVRPDNVPSQKLFLGSGFALLKEVIIRGTDLHLFSKPIR